LVATTTILRSCVIWVHGMWIVESVVLDEVAVLGCLARDVDVALEAACKGGAWGRSSCAFQRGGGYKSISDPRN
jgi:hypothetical protein